MEKKFQSKFFVIFFSLKYRESAPQQTLNLNRSQQARSPLDFFSAAVEEWFDLEHLIMAHTIQCKFFHL